MQQTTLRSSPGALSPRPFVDGALQPQLVVALQRDDLSQPPSRHLLGALTRVTIGRALERTTARSLEHDGGVLHLGLPDAMVSRQHAVLTRIGPYRWAVVDDGSTNGVRVNGRRLARRGLLLDGDLIEVGRTMLLYRECRQVAHPERPDLSSLELDVANGAATFVGSLATSFARIGRVARSTVPVSVSGPSGTGKELASRLVHRLSGRTGPFVAVNCGALTAGLVEASLFGHRRGSFSGAIEDRLGFVRAAHGGTLFLDEVAELPAAAQVALLRVLQEREVVPVGDFKPVSVDVRVVTATHEPLEALVARGTLRADLAARLSGLAVALPPLAQRREDLGLLVCTLAARLQPSITGLQRAAAQALFRHPWPLNVRELEKSLALAAVISDGRVGVEHLPPSFHDGDAPATATPLAEGSITENLAAGDLPAPALAPRQQAELEALLRDRGGNVTAVARLLGLSRMQVHRLIRKHGLDSAAFR